MMSTSRCMSTFPAAASRLVLCTSVARASHLLLDGLALLTREGYVAGAPALKLALRAFRDEPLSEEDELRWLWLACRIARALEDLKQAGVWTVGLAADAPRRYDEIDRGGAVMAEREANLAIVVR